MFNNLSSILFFPFSFNSAKILQIITSVKQIISILISMMSIEGISHTKKYYIPLLILISLIILFIPNVNERVEMILKKN